MDDEYSDSTFVENSCEDSETEEEPENALWPEHNAHVQKPRCVDATGTGEVCTANDSPTTKHPGTEAIGKKRKQAKVPSACGQKSKKARNTTRASKIQCLDATEIREFLRRPPACCKNKCLQKLNIFTDRAEKAVSDIRVARFRGLVPCDFLRFTIN